jgi:D-beta-D-heptose 7-phosphate kinase/D-beta-D-heptose 1-phosphate adenosyltransferase
MAPILTRDELLRARTRWRDDRRTVVFTNGCYDILHPGHVRFLQQAKALGDVLVLALNTDSSVRRNKGAARPIVPEHDRATVAAALACVDAVTLFDEDTPRELVARLLPDILVKGADWNHFVAGREEVEAAGGRVLTIPLEPGYSTSDIIKRIQALSA